MLIDAAGLTGSDRRADLESAKTVRTQWLRWPLALLLTSAGLTAAAETSPYFIGVSQAFSYNSNVFRQVDEFAQSSWWSSTSLVGGFDQRYGRQRFYANGNVATNIYGQVSQLDNTSYGVKAGWDWETIERLSGQLYASFDQNLANYGGFNTSVQNEKNVENAALALCHRRVWSGFTGGCRCARGLQLGAIQPEFLCD